MRSEVTRSPAPARRLPTRVRRLIIGAGFSGLGLAIKLDQAGDDDFLVVERDADVGGTWLANSYPGAACDVPSQLYSYSFAANPEWTQSFSKQPEILAYLRRVSEQSGVRGNFRFGVEVVEADWDDDARVWQVHTTAGTVVADILISAAGSLSAPKLPDISGIETFTGEIFHTARWNHDYDVVGKRVAVIGTGASAIQVVPQLQPQVTRLDVYQRTAPWVMPRVDRPYSRAERATLAKLPGLQKLYRGSIYASRETYVPMFTRFPKMALPAIALCRHNLNRSVKDKALREKLTPPFELGCKRVLISNDWYPALAAANTDVVVDPISEITPTGIRTSDGTMREVDAIVVATGFHTTDHPIADVIKGRGGRSLADVWAERGMSAYKGTAVSGFPNFFQLVGPNTVLGHSSMVYMIESQLAYLLSAFESMRLNRYQVVEVRAEAEAEWNDDLQARMGPTVWNTGGCASWYLDQHGRNTVLWPRTTYKFRELLSRFDVAAFNVWGRDSAAPQQPPTTTAHPGESAQVDSSQHRAPQGTNS